MSYNARFGGCGGSEVCEDSDGAAWKAFNMNEEDERIYRANMLHESLIYMAWSGGYWKTIEIVAYLWCNGSEVHQTVHKYIRDLISKCLKVSSWMSYNASE